MYLWIVLNLTQSTRLLFNVYDMYYKMGSLIKSLRCMYFCGQMDKKNWDTVLNFYIMLKSTRLKGLYGQELTVKDLLLNPLFVSEGVIFPQLLH